MKTPALLLGLVLAAGATPVLASAALVKSDPAGASVATLVAPQAAGSAAKERLICRRQQTTGARTGGERICLTKKDWRVVENGGTVTSYRNKAKSAR